MDLSLSVIIPTYNRKDTLQKCLSALSKQIDVPLFEVIVIDDGSSDGTGELIKGIQDKYLVSLKYFSQSNNGPASARNLGIRNANGRIILFIGDDIIAGKPTFLKEHLSWHNDSYPDEAIAVLGYTTWSPELRITPYMRWLEEGGPQFSYINIKSGTFIDYRHFYTSNISLKRAFLSDDLFNELFRYAAYEDNELAYRLSRRGLKIVYNQDAIAYHCHKITLENYSMRAFFTGKSAALLSMIQPDLFNKKIAPLWRRVVKGFIFEGPAKPVSMYIARYFEERCMFPLLFSSLYSYYFWKGFLQEDHKKSLR